MTQFNLKQRCGATPPSQMALFTFTRSQSIPSYSSQHVLWKQMETLLGAKDSKKSALVEENNSAKSFETVIPALALSYPPMLMLLRKRTPWAPVWRKRQAEGKFENKRIMSRKA